MGITIDWEDDSKRIFCYQLDEHWTWDEFFVAKKQADAIMDSVSHKISVIVNIASRTALRPNLLSTLRKALDDKHPNIFVIVLVISDSFTRTTISQLYDIIRFSSIRVEIVSSLDEAHAIIDTRLRETLPPSDPQ